MTNIPPVVTPVNNWKHIWTYTDKNGVPLGQVRRTADKKISQWKPDGNGGWISGGAFKGVNKPLYGLPMLCNGYPLDPILIVEGEKTCEAAHQRFFVSDISDSPRLLCTTWFGGTGSVAKVDLEPLEGRHVILWPDNDDVGKKAMEALAQRLLREGAASVRMVDVSEYDLPKGWDLADEGLLDYEISGLIESAREVTLVVENPPVIRKSRAVSNKQNSVLFPDLSRDGKHRPLNTIPNLEMLMSHYGIVIRENLMTHNLEYSGLQCAPKNYSASIKSLCSLHGLSATKVDEYMGVIADKLKFHPVGDWINSSSWDGINRFDDLLKTLTTDDNPILVKELLYRWMLGAIEAIYSPIGVRMPGALVLQGFTGIGKTYWMLKLAPEAFVKEGESIGANDKDSVMQVTSRWIVELGEIASTYIRSDMHSLKNFITRGADTYRKSFRRDEQTEPRRTVFFGSVNEQNYLVDKTGNRRWWTISVTAIDSYHEINMQQLWAQILDDYQKGNRCKLPKEMEKLLLEHNKQFEVRDYLHDLLLEKFRWDEPVEHHSLKTANEILKELCPGESKETYNRMYKKIATILQESFRLKSKHTKQGNVYLMPSFRWN